MQNFIVAVIVVYACWYVLRRYLPKSVKRNATQKLAVWCAHQGWTQLSARLASSIESAPAQGGCDSCSACASDAGAKDKAGKGTTQTISAEALRRTIKR